jgi:hypothetical protein
MSSFYGLLFCGLLGSHVPINSAHAASIALDRYVGSFAASGTVLEGPDANSHTVRCRFIASLQGATGLSLRGTCRAYMIISRSISVDLTWDPKSGHVIGTYTGSRVGTARLIGRQMGNELDLKITWPRPLYGDTTATLKVVGVDANRFRIVVMDRIGVNGPSRATTDLALLRN